ncbi:hypothetical protein [Niabella beijingensis]|uniref:hypothetical protein n=1 Tax=Niabella beijingensis TaxID=2872700 RepID=UPI001CBA6BB1|nr:hypothetical protein [Niabella beijingensis]MBZ4189325.1 hypothetical protein [Niabella beijingensis]
MNLIENKDKPLTKIYAAYPDARSADFGAFRGDVGFWVILAEGACIFYPLIEPVKFAPSTPEAGKDLFWVFNE